MGQTIQFPPQQRGDDLATKEGEVVKLDDSRPSVWYDIAVCHHADGTIETFTRGIETDSFTRAQLAVALRAVADGIEALESKGTGQ